MSPNPSSPHAVIIRVRQNQKAMALKIGDLDMKRHYIGRAIFFAATAACLALGAGQAGAMGGGNGSQSSDLAASASPYALLAPVTVAQTPGGEGRAAFEGYSSLSGSMPCQPGRHLMASSYGGSSCMPDR
jgi:hypothetical protein